ncbi:uncharacterized protein LOC135384464 [Ornithodoros turicata]|uniref:uncharacterized protein LOC135384464 n=1 Tax=Ornithodoros turicata TaxID=34597 RepID=UPI00313899A6
MELLAKKRKALRSQVTRLINEVQEALTLSGTEDVCVFEDRLKALQLQLNAVDDKIEQERADQLDEAEFEQVFQYNNKLVTCLAKLAHRREAFEASERAARDSSGSNPSNGTALSMNRTKVRLPKLELMRFNGERTTWQQFWEQFDLVVHRNEDLTEVDKFNYLKGCLTADAAAAVKGLPPTARCYNDAIDLLKRRFGDEELLVQSHMRKLIDLNPVCSSDDVKGLRHLYDNVVAHVRGLEALGRKRETFSSLLLPILQRALPRDILLSLNKRNISERRDSTAAVLEMGQQETGDSARQGTIDRSDSFTQLLDFLKVQVQSREDVEFMQHMSSRTKKQDSTHSNKDRGKRKGSRKSSSTAVLQQSTQVNSCFFCKAESHSTLECDMKIGLEEKKNRLRSERRCFRCTRPNHQAKTCRSQVKCKNCGGRHATVMCDPDFVQKKASTPDAITSVPVNLERHSDQRRSAVLLPTLTVWGCRTSQREHVRALLDSGSQRSFVCTEISRKMRCKKVGTETLTVGVFGGHQTEKEFPRVLVRLEIGDGKCQEIEALEIETICNQFIPSPSSAVAKKLTQLQCRLGDTSALGGPVNIGLLFRCEHYWTVTTGRSRKLNGQLRAIETVFGWAVQGPAPEEAEGDGQCSQAIALKAALCNRDTSDILTKFWALEAIGIDDMESQGLGDPVVNYFEQTVSKSDERYEVALPWMDHVNLNNNKEVAKRRLQQLTRSLQKAPVLLKAYDVAIRQYYGDDMAELVGEDIQTEHFTYYMPHQAVVREANSTTKLRVMCDASSHAPGSLSLNDNLQSGPNLTADLVALLLNFRQHNVALVADMEKARFK